MKTQQFSLWYMLIALVLGLIIYIPSINNQFVYDDIPYIQENYQIQSPRYLFEMLYSTYPPESKEQGLYRPVLTLSYFVDYQLWGGANPKGFHFTNLVLYLAIIAVFWLIARKLLNNNPLTILIAALLFAAHPVHAESVNWAVGRCALLSTLFVLLSFYTYMLFRERQDAVSSRFMIISLVAFALALGSYEITIIYPLLLITYEMLILKKRWRDIFMTTNSMIYELGVVGIIVLYLVLRLLILGGIGPQSSHQIMEGMSLLKRLWFLPLIYIMNLKILFFPFRMTTLYEYDIKEGILPFPVEASILLFAALLILLGYFLHKKYRLPAFGLLWVLFTILPVSNIIPVGILISERTLFLPSVGLCFLLAGIAGLIVRHDRPLLKVEQNLYVIVLAACILIFYTARSIDRTSDWRTPLSFWQSELHMHPDSASAHNSLGWYYHSIGDRSNAKLSFRTAIEKQPDQKYAYYNLAKLLIEQREFDEARQVLMDAAKLGAGSRGSNFSTIGTLMAEIGDDEAARDFFEKAVEAEPTNGAALFELGNYALQAKEPIKAIEYLTKALDESTHAVRAGIYNSLGIAHASIGNKEQAIKDFHNAIKTNPTLEGPYLRLAEIYLSGNEVRAAETILRQSIEQARPLSPTTFMYLVRALTAQEKYQEGISVTERWENMSPPDPGIFLVRAQLYLALRDGNAAINAIRGALRINPQFVPAYEMLGDICYRARRPADARKFWEKALSLAPDNKEIKEKLQKMGEIETAAGTDATSRMDIDTTGTLESSVVSTSPTLQIE